MPSPTSNLPEPTAVGEVLQEYADNRGIALRVDRAAGVIHGVKLLGTLSRKGREYPRAVIEKALPLYEGMRVNVDHVEPGQRRSLRDRIGLVKNVALKEDGLYGDFHYNPRHALAEQIAWDAENAPHNLGFSHDTRGGTRNVGGRIVVESIDKVLSVNLVANPATTNGLFEDEFQTPSKEPLPMELKDLTLDQLKQDRPDLVAALQESAGCDRGLKALEEEVSTLPREKAARELQEQILHELTSAGLDPANKAQCSEIFLEDLAATADAARRKAKIDDRKALAAAAHGASNPRTGSPLQEAADGAVPPATAPLAQRLARFTK